MKLAEINEMSLNEITEQVKKSQLELVGLRMKFASRQLEDTSLIKKKRKEIARLLTVETQKINSPDKTKEENIIPQKPMKTKKIKEAKKEIKPESMTSKKGLKKKKGQEDA